MQQIGPDSAVLIESRHSNFERRLLILRRGIRAQSELQGVEAALSHSTGIVTFLTRHPRDERFMAMSHSKSNCALSHATDLPSPLKLSETGSSSSYERIDSSKPAN